MHGKVQRWGNSLAIRIPRSMAHDAGLGVDCPVDIRLQDGNVVVKPLPARQFSLSQLLDQVSDSNLHGEIETDGPVGGEVW